MKAMLCQHLGSLRMNKKVDSKFFLVYTILEALSFIATIVLFVISIASIIKNKSLNNELFELVYFGIHIIIHFMALAFTFKAIKNESFIIKSLAYNRYSEHQRSRGATIICSVFIALFMGLLTYSILIYTNSNIYDFHFTPTLKLVIIAVSVFMIISLSSFIIYPFIYKQRK